MCPNCKGQGWVCENHPNVPWGDGDSCCGGAGQQCDCVKKPQPPKQFTQMEKRTPLFRTKRK